MSILHLHPHEPVGRHRTHPVLSLSEAPSGPSSWGPDDGSVEERCSFNPGEACDDGVFEVDDGYCHPQIPQHSRIC